MTIEKTKAYVLKTIPYRESSGIFYLLTERQGIVHGIAKGIRKKKTGMSFLERGFLIETLVYSKPHRELHMLGDIQMIDYYPRIRNDLIRGAVRDAAFETILESVSTGFPYPELFSLIAAFCMALEERPRWLPPLLWNFYAAFSHCMGFGMDAERCVSCKKILPGSGTVSLVVEKGGFTCNKCETQRDQRTVLPAMALQFLVSPAISPFPALQAGISPDDERRITRLLASYCQYHCDTCSDLKALAFLDALLFARPAALKPVA
jgi:DNA repair protein RecO (recombination protein O)